MCPLAFTLSAAIDPQRNPALVSTFLSISEHLPYLSPSLNVPLCGRVFPPGCHHVDFLSERCGNLIQGAIALEPLD